MVKSSWRHVTWTEEAAHLSRHRVVEVDGVRIFYRVIEARNEHAPTVLLLHGFPSSSFQFRGLMRELGGRFRIIAPDYPGFGYSDSPGSTTDGGVFAYTFDHLAEVMERFCIMLQLDRFVAYLFDFGALSGFGSPNAIPSGSRG
jgi:pimeloyl-ACP methyl ester carboxylesterase